VAGAAILFEGRGATPLRFEIGPSDPSGDGAPATPGIVGEWIAAPPRSPLPVRFSDGSVVRLEATTRARVIDLESDGSRVLLESGAAHASVVHRDRTRWSVQAGPFEVHVVGTQFEVAWEPARQTFTLTLEEGQVTVSGCALARPRVVRTGETFQMTCREGEDPLAADAAPLAPPPSPEPTAEALAPVAPRPSPAAPAPGWRQLLAAGHYEEAVAAADEAGLATICATADAESLMRLGDAARFAHRPDRAAAVLREVRRRFHDRDEEASVAAFDLGRIAFDDRAAYADAARWFDVYLRERPAGPLAREASGRRMEALERSGDRAAAVAAAERYLETFPGGPHESLARTLVGP